MGMVTLSLCLTVQPRRAGQLGYLARAFHKLLITDLCGSDVELSPSLIWMIIPVVVIVPLALLVWLALAGLA